MKTKLHERTLVLLKPDVIQRGIMGEIITRFERKGLKIIAAKLVQPSPKQAADHYDMPKEDKLLLGNRTLAGYKEKGIKNTKSPIEIAEDIQRKLVKYITAGPVLAMLIEGAHAIEQVRKIRGHTNPLTADIGSITADYTIDSYFLADDSERAVRTLVHASGSTEEAKREIKLWFNDNEIFDYDLAIEKILYDKAWEETRDELTKEH